MIKSSARSDFVDENCECCVGAVLLSKVECRALKGKVNANPKFDEISNGMKIGTLATMIFLHWARRSEYYFSGNLQRRVT